MGTGIHRRDTDDGPRYRLWSTSMDCYVSVELTRDELRERLIADEAARVVSDIERRLQRVDTRGTSFTDERDRDTSGPWETERCEWCECFHHGWSPSGHAADYGPGLVDVDYSAVNKEIQAGATHHPLMGCAQCGMIIGDDGHSKPCTGPTDGG